MQIILIRSHKVGAVHLSQRHIAIILCMAVLTMVMLSGAAMWLAVKRGLVPSAMIASAIGVDPRITRESLNLMAERIGEMQAQMTRLDALGARVSGLAGVSPNEFDFKSAPGRGGPEGALSQAVPLSEVQSELDRLMRSADQRNDYLSVLESTLMSRRILARMLPKVRPVATGYDSSGFGVRIDPFTGRRAQHDGVDFVAPVGTPIVAAAGGVVVASEWHHEYGNMIDIDHGRGLKTRYGHASAVFVKVGDIVRAGQRIALIGRTGRATGPHLHFEVRVNEAPQNPVAFLEGVGASRMAAASARAKREAAGP